MNFLSKIAMFATLLTTMFSGFAMDAVTSITPAVQEAVAQAAMEIALDLPALEAEVAPNVWATVENTVGNTVGKALKAGHSHLLARAESARDAVANVILIAFNKAGGNYAVAKLQQGFDRAYGNEAVALVKAHPAISTAIALALGTVAVVKFAPRIFPTKAAQKAKNKAVQKTEFTKNDGAFMETEEIQIEVAQTSE